MTLEYNTGEGERDRKEMMGRSRDREEERKRERGNGRRWSMTDSREKKITYRSMVMNSLENGVEMMI